MSPCFNLRYILTYTIMDTQKIIGIIRESFEQWYNIVYGSDISIIIDYKDVQTLSMKAYHTVTMEVSAIGIEDGKSYTRSLIRLQENYNHGTTTEEDAKLGLTRKILMEMYSYQVSML